MEILLAGNVSLAGKEKKEREGAKVEDGESDCHEETVSLNLQQHPGQVGGRCQAVPHIQDHDHELDSSTSGGSFSELRC